MKVMEILNAKELILAKINGGDNLAKCHLYLMMLGFDIKDIVSFMTSPYVNLVSELSEENMLDDYVPSVSVRDAIDMSRGIVNVDAFIQGTRSMSFDELQEYGDETGGRINKKNELFGKLQGSTLGQRLWETYKAKYGIPDGEVAGETAASGRKKPRNLKDFVQMYVDLKIDDDTIPSLIDFLGDRAGNRETRNNLGALSDHVDKLAYRIRKAIGKYQNAQDFYADMDEFENVLELSDEMSSLGSTFLKLNQGIPSSKDDMMTNIRSITYAMGTREKKYGLVGYYDGVSVFKGNDGHEKQREKLDGIVNKIIADSGHASDEYGSEQVKNVIKLAHAFDIIGNFDFEKWIGNEPLGQVINNEFIGEEIGEVPQNYSYRDLVSDYYNVMKGTFNVFDVVTKVPQYESILRLYRYAYMVDKLTSIKSNLMNRIYDDIIERENFFDNKKINVLKKYANDLLITSYLNQRSFKFPIRQGQAYIDKDYLTQVATHDLEIDLSTPHGRASFKKAFEEMMITLRRTGEYGDVRIDTPQGNRFLNDLQVTYDKDGVTSLVTEMDLRNIDANATTQKVFQQYMNGIGNLKGVMVGGRSLLDWFMIYNLFANQNQYGSDRLTSIFQNHISDDSVLADYFKYIGDLDYELSSSDLRETLGYDVEDLLVRMAPFVPKSMEVQHKEKYIRQVVNDQQVLKKRVKSGYMQIDTFPENSLVDGERRKEQERNYLTYQSIKLKSQDFNIGVRNGMLSDQLSDLIQTIKTLQRKGIIKIYKENC